MLPDSYTFETFFIPARMMPSLKAWVLQGREPGHFLQAVLENDLKEAVIRADAVNKANLPAFVAFLYNECPADCWGSKEKYAAWRKLS